MWRGTTIRDVQLRKKVVCLELVGAMFFLHLYLCDTATHSSKMDGRSLTPGNTRQKLGCVGRKWKEQTARAKVAVDHITFLLLVMTFFSCKVDYQ